MRTIFTLIILMAATLLKAQVAVPLSFMDYTQRAAFSHRNNFNDTIKNHKWFLSAYTGFSTGFMFYKGDNATVFTAPVALQLNRRLNNNLYTFAGVSVSPAYINFKNNFPYTDVSKSITNSSFLKTGNFGMYSRVDVGIGYVNDAKTFSISGSIGVERSSYPVFQYNQMNTTKQPAVIAPINKQ